MRPLGPLVFAVSLFLTVALIMLAAKGVLDRLAASRPRPIRLPAAVEPSSLPPEPRLQSSPTADLRAMRGREAKELNGYGWVDRPAGVIHIPIDRAMRLVADRGLPSWRPSLPGPAAGKDAQQEPRR